MKNFNIQKHNDLEYITFPILESFTNIAHGFTTRNKGMSSPPFNSLNMATNQEDDLYLVKQNYELLSNALNLKPNFHILKQVHGSDGYIVDTSNFESILNPSLFQNGDYLITNTPGIILSLQFADCVPIILFDPTLNIVALAHAGWKGTLSRISSKVVSKMISVFNSKPKDIIAVIGPSISPNDFEVGSEVFDKFASVDIFNDSNILLKNKTSLKIDLWNANKKDLIEIGLLEENIQISNLSTLSSSFLFSYRRDNGNTGRMCSFITLLK